MTSYLGTQAQALGLKRNYGGILGRADRLVLMLLIIFIGVVFPFNYLFYIHITPINILLLWFLIAGYITSGERFIQAMRDLKHMG